MIAVCLLAWMSGSAASAVGAQDAPRYELRWNPAAGARITRRVDLSHELALSKLAIFQGGTEQIAQQRLTVKSGLQVLMRDELRQVDERGPLLLQRKLDDWLLDATLTTVQDGRMSATPFEAASPLTGTSVVHTRLADGSYGRHYDEREASEEFLARLWEDADLRAFLPAQPVAEGAGWAVPPAALVEALCPGGPVPLRYAKGDDNLYARQLGAGLGGPLHELLPGARFEGGIQAKLLRVETVQDSRQAVIEFAVDVRAYADQSAFANENLGKYDLLDGRKVVKSDATFALQGAGELRFGLAEGFVRSFVLEGKERVGAEVVAEKGGKDDLRQTIELAGTLKLSWTNTPAKARKVPSAPPK